MCLSLVRAGVRAGERPRMVVIKVAILYLSSAQENFIPLLPQEFPGSIQVKADPSRALFLTLSLAVELTCHD